MEKSDFIVPTALQSTPMYDPSAELGLQPFSYSTMDSWDPSLSDQPDHEVSRSSCLQQLRLTANAYENGATCTYSSEAKMLFVAMDTPVHITFDVAGGSVPEGASLLAMVWYRDHQHRHERGPVVRCPKHLAGDSECQDFITCHHPASKNYVAHGHRCTFVPVQNLQWSPEGYHCSYSYNCMTSCLGAGKQKAELVTIFILCLNDQELARETIITRVCSCPLRDRRKTLGDMNPQKRTCHSTSPTPTPSLPVPSQCHMPLDLFTPQLMMEAGDAPDEEGYYTFTWKLKDRSVYSMLLLMKSGYDLMRQAS